MGVYFEGSLFRLFCCWAPSFDTYPADKTCAAPGVSTNGYSSLSPSQHEQNQNKADEKGDQESKAAISTSKNRDPETTIWRYFYNIYIYISGLQVYKVQPLVSGKLVVEIYASQSRISGENCKTRHLPKALAGIGAKYDVPMISYSTV